MTAQATGSWGTWQQTRNTLVQTLSMNIELRNQQPVGSAEEIALNQNIKTNLKDMQDHALAGLRQVNASVLASGNAAKLTKASKEAKAEADRIRRAVEKVEELTELTAKLTKLVVGIAAL